MCAKTILLLALTSLVSFGANAATATATLGLSGSITEQVSLVVTPNANATSLPLTTTTTDLSIASVAETSNAANGYTISAKSTNASELIHSADSSQKVAYTIKYGASAAITLTAVDQVVKTQNTGGNYNGVASAVSISYTGVSASTRKAGTYTDTITFTITGL